MGKLTEETLQLADLLVSRIGHLGEVTTRKMFGGVGVFESGAMFALVSSESVVHFKSSEQNLAQFETAGSTKFGRMPYYSVPGKILEDQETLETWALSSIAVNASG